MALPSLRSLNVHIVGRFDIDEQGYLSKLPIAFAMSKTYLNQRSGVWVQFVYNIINSNSINSIKTRQIKI